MIKAMRKNPVLVAIVVSLIGFCGLKYLPYDGEDLPSLIIIRVVLSVLMIGTMLLMGAGDTLKEYKKGFGYTLRSCWYVLVIALIMGGFAAVAAFIKNGIPNNFLMLELSYFTLSIMVGIFEESMFRGVLFHGILRKTGKTRSGVWRAIIISSLLFGVFHVTNYIFGGSYDLAGILQTIGKTLEAAMFGTLLCAVYLKTKNFWAIAFVHAMNDFIPFQNAIFSSSVPSTNYVHSGAMGIGMIVGYVILLLINIPLLLKARKIMKEIKTPEYGVFKEK